MPSLELKPVGIMHSCPIDHDEETVALTQHSTTQRHSKTYQHETKVSSRIIVFPPRARVSVGGLKLHLRLRHGAARAAGISAGVRALIRGHDEGGRCSMRQH